MVENIYGNFNEKSQDIPFKLAVNILRFSRPLHFLESAEDEDGMMVVMVIMRMRMMTKIATSIY